MEHMTSVLATITLPFDATSVYLVGESSYSNPPLALSIGLCVPKHCSSNDISNIINLSKIFEVSNQTVYCDDVKKAPYGPGAIAMIVVCLLFLCLVGIGTTVDLILMWVPACFTRHYDTRSVNASINEEMPLLMKPTAHKNEGNVKLWDFIAAFSLYKTVPTLLATKQAASVISSLNGLRVISMFWVILCHTYETASFLLILSFFSVVF